MVGRGGARAAFKVARESTAAGKPWIRPMADSEQVHNKLIGSALARARCELDLNRVGSVLPALSRANRPPDHDLIVIRRHQPSPEQRNRLAVRGDSSTLDEARTSLSDPVGPFREARHWFAAPCSRALETVKREVTPLLGAKSELHLGRRDSQPRYSNPIAPGFSYDAVDERLAICGRMPT